MANRFDKTYDQQTWVSSYVPLPLKDIEAGYKGQQKKYDDAMTAVADAPVISGGNSTKDVAAKFEADKNKYIAEQVEEASKTKDYGQLPNKIKMYKNKLEADPFYQGILLDKTLSPGADAVIIGDKDRQVAQTFYDYDKGAYEQVTDKPFTADHYAAMAPPKTQEIFKPYYDQIQDVIEQKMNPDGTLEKQFNPDGSISYIQNGTKVVRNVTRDELRKIAEPLMGDASFRALDPFGYNKLRHKQLFGKDYVDANGVVQKGSQWDDNNDPLDIFVDNYLKTKREETETQKLLYTTKVPKDDDGGGGGGGTTKQEAPIDNRMLGIIKESHESGGSMLDADEAAAILGAKVDASKNVVANATGRNWFLNIGNAGDTPEKVEENALIGRTIPFKQKENEIIKANSESVKNLPTSQTDARNNLDAKYATGSGASYVEKIYSKVPGTNTGLLNILPTYKEYNSATGQTRTMDEKEFENTEYFKDKLSRINKNDPSYDKLKKDAEKAGVDLNDVEINKKINNIGDSESLATMNSMLNNIKGEITFIPGSGKNFTGDDMGTSLISGDVFVTTEQMKQMAPDNAYFSSEGYHKLENDKLIYPHTIHKVNAKGEDVEVEGYVFHVTTPVIGQDVGNATRNVTSNKAGGYHEWVAKVVPKQIEEVNNELYRIKLEKRITKFENKFTKYPDQTILDLNKDYDDVMSGKYVNENGALVNPPTPEQKSAIDDAKTKIMTDSKLSKAEKARALFQIKVRLTDPTAYSIMYPNATGGQGLGKQGAQQDNSNPLGM